MVDLLPPGTDLSKTLTSAFFQMDDILAAKFAKDGEKSLEAAKGIYWPSHAQAARNVSLQHVFRCLVRVHSPPSCCLSIP